MILEDLIADLKSDEGFVPYAYRDHLGYLTIGYGRLIDKERGGRISEAEAEVLLQNDIVKFVNQLDAVLPWWRNLSDTRQNVLINMAFNLGIKGLLGFKNTLAKMQFADYAGAAENMLKSKWAKQVPNRAKRLSDQMRKG